MLVLAGALRRAVPGRLTRPSIDTCFGDVLPGAGDAGCLGACLRPIGAELVRRFDVKLQPWTETGPWGGWSLTGAVREVSGAPVDDLSRRGLPGRGCAGE